MASGLQSIGFKISTKSALLTNSARATHLVTSVLKGQGIKIKCVSNAPDLGIDQTATGKRSKEKGRAREKAAEAKHERIERLKNTKLKAQLTRSITMSKSVYGTEVVAVTPAEASGIKRKLVNALGYKAGMCSLSLLKIHGQTNPIADIRWLQFGEWISLWCDKPELHDQMRDTWKKMRTVMHSDDITVNYQKATGPIGSMLAMLLELGFEVDEPDRWDTCRGRIWEMTEDPIDIDEFKKEFFEVIEAHDWSKASRHHLGQGLEEGADFSAVAKLRKRFVHDGDPMAVGLLDFIATAGLWTNRRCHEAG
jgi:hypothetical protein